MGILCLEGSPKNKQNKQLEIVYSNSKLAAQNNPENAKRILQLERQIDRLIKKIQKLETTNIQQSRKYVEKLKEQQNNNKFRQAQIKQQSLELAKRLQGKLYVTQQQKQLLEKSKKIQQQEACNKLKELNQKYEKKLYDLQEQYQIKRQNSSILRQQTNDTIKELIQKHKAELQGVIQDNRKQLESNRKKIEGQYRQKIKVLEKEVENSNKNNQKINKQKQNSNYFHHRSLFQNEIFEDEAYSTHKSFLISSIESRMNKMIVKTRLLFKFDLNNKTNFHTYIDNKPNIAVIVKLSNEYFIAGFTQVAFLPKSTAKGEAMILSLTNKKVFYLFDPDKKPISYDEYYLIFGNSQLRLRSQQKKIFSNFGVSNTSFNSKGSTVDILLGAGREREVDIDYYQIYQIFFEE